MQWIQVEIKKLVKVEAHGKELYLDGYLKENLDLLKVTIEKDWDFIFCLDGLEGAGKSTLAQQMAAYVGKRPLELDNICFTPEEFVERVKKANRYDSIIFDEAFGMTSSEHMTEINRALKRTLAEIRQRNLFVFIILPSFFELMKYCALHRSIALLHVYTGKGFERGYFKFFNRAKKLELYLKGKQYYQYVVKPNFRGRFTKTYVVDEKAYRKKKMDTFREGKRDKASSQENKYLVIAGALMKQFYEQGYSHQKISDMLKKYGRKYAISRRTVGRTIEQLDIHNL